MSKVVFSNVLTNLNRAQLSNSLHGKTKLPLYFVHEQRAAKFNHLVSASNSVSKAAGLSQPSAAFQWRFRYYPIGKLFGLSRSSHANYRSLTGIHRTPKTNSSDGGGTRAYTNQLNQLEQQQITPQQSASIFTRFKEAYKQHGKVLVCCHLVLCVGWITGFYILSTCGFNLTTLLDLLQQVHIFSKETCSKIVDKINTFNLEKFLRDYYFDYVMPNAWVQWLGKSVTGETLKHFITAVMLYKIFTPFRCLLTLACTRVLINVFKKKGVIPISPPPGSSITDLYTEQKQVLRRSIRYQRDKYGNTRIGRLLKRQNSLESLPKRKRN